MATEPLCASCKDPATRVYVKPHSLTFCCSLHSAKVHGFPIEKSNSGFFELAERLLQNPHLSHEFWGQYLALPKNIAKELASSWKETEDYCRFRALARPEDLVRLKDRDRLLRFLMKAGVQFPNNIIMEVRAERLLEQMLRARTSITVIQSAFARWPVGADKFRVLGCLLKSPYAPFEKKVLVEMMLPYYVELALNQSLSRSIEIIELTKDVKLKRLAMSYVNYLQSLYVLKATEVCSITMRLPRSLRRYIVEIFICAC
jgi:hypothetical protein